MTRFLVVVSSGVLRFFGGLTAAELDAAPFRLYSLIFVLPETLVQNEEFHSLLSSAVYCTSPSMRHHTFILAKFTQILFTKKGQCVGVHYFGTDSVK